MSQQVIDLLQQAIALLTQEQTNAPAQLLRVFDVQEKGYSKLGAVEEFREELRKSDEPLKRRFAELLPVWWYVQDQEDYVRLNTEQMELQEFNCGNARFNIAIMGQAATNPNGRSTLWRTWWPAVVREYSEAGNRMVDTPIVHSDGAGVFAVANDSRTWGGRALTSNPRVEDMPEVIRAAYNYFYLANKDATIPVEAVYRRED